MRITLTVVQGRSAPRLIEFDSPNLDEARQRAAAQGYVVLSAQTAQRWTGGTLGQRARSQKFDVPVFVDQLRDLLVAGLSVIEALDALKRGARPSSAASIEALERQLREGRPLSGALATMPVFPPLLIALVKASELTSDLPQSLARYIDHEHRIAEVRHRIISASVYPMMLCAMGVLVQVFLLFYVVPRFARIFEGMTGELPWSARAMVAWSNGLRDHGVWLALIMAAGVGAVAALALLPALRAPLLRRVLQWAPLREQLKLYFLSRWYHATGLLVQGGIPLPQALALAAGLLPAAFAPAARQVEEGVSRGLAPSVAHAQAGMATPVAEQLLLAGERTGDLGTVLTRIARYHENEVGRTLERVMRVFEPVVMVVIGLAVGIVVVLMYMPIFELAAAIN